MTSLTVNQTVKKISISLLVSIRPKPDALGSLWGRHEFYQDDRSCRTILLCLCNRLKFYAICVSLSCWTGISPNFIAHNGGHRRFVQRGSIIVYTAIFIQHSDRIQMMTEVKCASADVYDTFRKRNRSQAGVLWKGTFTDHCNTVRYDIFSILFSDRITDQPCQIFWKQDSSTIGWKMGKGPKSIPY